MQRQRSYIALSITLLIWGSTFVITKVVLQDMGPLTLTLLRFIIAFAVLAPLAARQGFRLKTIFQPTYLLFGLTGTTLYYALQNLGLKYTSISSTVLILAIIPAITAVLARIFLKETLGTAQLMGIALVTVGMILVGVFESGSADSSNPTLGNLLILGSALAWSIYTIQGRKMVTAQPALAMAAGSTGAGILFLIPFAVWELGSGVALHLSLAGILGTLFLGLAASGLTTYLWNYALHELPASVAAPFINLVPIIGLASALLSGEKPPAAQIAGGVFAILGVVLSSLPQPQKDQAASFNK